MTGRELYKRSYPNRLYKEWAGMRRRCTHASASHFEHYGGRGIKVCEEWVGHEGFTHFANWACSNGYAPNLEIDRIDTDGNYSPSNCRWVSRKENSRNRHAYREAVRAHVATNINSKIIGVNFRPSRTGVRGNWRAMIMVDGKNISLGTTKKSKRPLRQGWPGSGVIGEVMPYDSQKGLP